MGQRETGSFGASSAAAHPSGHAYDRHMWRPRALNRLGQIALVMATVVLGHELTYLLANGLSGYDAAMQEAGHERYWTTLILTVAGITSILTVVAVRQLRRLQRLTAGFDTPTGYERSLFRELLGRVWRRTALGALFVYYVQENVESLTSGQSAPGLEVFLGEHVSAAPVLLLVGLLVATVGALVVWRRNELIKKLRSIATATMRQAPRTERDTGALTPRWIDTSFARAVRAPPLPSAI